MKATIKAHYATVEGDYVIVRKTPYRATRIFLLLMWFIIAMVCIALDISLFIIGLISLIFLVFITFLLSDEKIYTVPKRDLIAIKHYPRRHRVTVVFDDEKNKLDILKK